MRDPAMMVSLWDAGRSFPPADCGPPPGTAYTLVHRQTPDYRFLHEPRIGYAERTLLVSFSNAPAIESEPAQIMRGRRSHDGGRTWSAPEIVAGGFPDGRRRHETAPFLVRADGVWVLVGRYDLGSKSSIGMEVYRLDPATDRYEPASDGVVAPGFVPFVAPQLLSDGRWIVGGHVEQVTRAAVAISQDDSLMRWHVVPLGTDIHPGYPETAVLIQGDDVLAIVRPPKGDATRALATISHDNGRTFGPLVQTDLPMHDSKPFAGRLGDGRGYLIWNQGSPGRDTLWLGLTAPGSLGPIQRVWRLVGGRDDALPGDMNGIGETAATHEWAYPEAVEHDGVLSVVFSLNKRHCYLAQVPLSSLD